MRFIILGSAAGGGFPQWNCACANCRLAWKGDPRVRPATQSSLALQLADEHWLLVNAAPEILQQIAAVPALQPRHAPRHSPISDILLTSAEIDHVAGLLSLRERQPLALRGTRRVLGILASNAIFDALHPEAVTRLPFVLEQPIAFPGITITPFAVAGKAPLYLEDAAPAVEEEEDTIALEFRDAAGRKAFYVPGCRKVTPALRERLDGAALLLFDGTLWTDDEMRQAGVGTRTGQDMGHHHLGGADGSIAALEGVRLERKIFIHINNTNPLLRRDSDERRLATGAGWQVAHDGMELVL
ncbi:pyrroloquinoline quinone biosynthesis protein PqqB [Pseudoroseomonas ludipueritiae]|uniref:Coenzyme PQQ synthesis protein B n=1 Tax=Pseudoroseomonas ludipueritiae TaxID=198093 RepID=A0ABR7R9R9_9PROT|nr:pyrroloquinoline quinone biosynthesis protein PqqB [Pseudoroseomonas ludipueritiae]MBC9178170.1 pyrroloquinoline quinone biosynthesis protein PqqB [Pseudoroseomonas ludipueritiae]